MNFRGMLMQPDETLYPITIKSGGSISYPFEIRRVQGYGGRGLQWGMNEANGWTAADLVAYFSDDAVPDPTSGTEANKRGDFKADGSTAASWYLLEDRVTRLPIRITSIPTAGGSNFHLMALDPQFWVLGTWKWLRFQSINTGSTAAVNQGADRTFYIKPLY